jgi:hypothetical protein
VKKEQFMGKNNKYENINTPEIKEMVIPTQVLKRIISEDSFIKEIDDARAFAMGYVTIIIGKVNGSFKVKMYHETRKPSITEIFKVRNELIPSNSIMLMAVETNVEYPNAVYLSGAVVNHANNTAEATEVQDKTNSE